MPKSSLDWLAVVSVWIGAIVLAFKSWGAPLVSGAPTVLTAPFWNFIPAVLVSFALGAFIYRQFKPIAFKPDIVQAGERKAVAGSALPFRLKQRSSVLYDTKLVARDARSAMADNPTHRTAEKQLPRIRAMMLTLSKEFGVSFPKSTGKANLDLEGYLRVIEEMLPYLSEGHDEAAREVGEKWISKLDQQA